MLLISRSPRELRTVLAAPVRSLGDAAAVPARQILAGSGRSDGCPRPGPSCCFLRHRGPARSLPLCWIERTPMYDRGCALPAHRDSARTTCHCRPVRRPHGGLFSLSCSQPPISQTWLQVPLDSPHQSRAEINAAVIRDHRGANLIAAFASDELVGASLAKHLAATAASDSLQDVSCLHRISPSC